MEKDNIYEENNIGYDFQYPNGGIKCKNYELCEGILPKWWFECKGNYLSTSCHMMFGTWGEQTGKGILHIYDNLDCPICFETKKCITQPNCEHTLCIECFKRCYYGSDTEDEPVFPYPDIEDDYYNDPLNSKWNNLYPLCRK